MKKLILIITLLLSISAFAETITVGSVIDFSAKDQFDRVNSTTEATRFLLFAAHKKTSDFLLVYLDKKDKGYLENNKILYIADIHGMPSLISKMFALPKMRKLSYSILLIQDDKAGKIFPLEENKLTVIKLKANVVQSIKYTLDSEELDKLLAE